MKEIVVIGGGAAGLMAAIAASEKNAKVCLLEPNDRLGKKINITGKGRCNVTNYTDLDGLMENIPRNGRFLFSALSHWMPEDTMAFFEKQGVALKVERGNRVFPVSDSAFDISDALRKRAQTLGVEWIHDRGVSIQAENQKIKAVQGEKGTYPCQAVILATGGISYPGTGSTGDGYRLAEEMGHSIVPPTGSLVPLVSPCGDCGAMQGLSLKNVEVTACNEKNKVVFREFGEMLFTHFGVSGPVILSMSAHLRDWDKHCYHMVIDLKPALTEEKLENRILRDIADNPNQDVSNLLAGLVPHSMVQVMMDRLSFPSGKKNNSITRSQRQALLTLLKRFEIPLTGPRGVEEAIVTSGGVKVSEVDPATMASKIIDGLYFAGEVLDVDAYTGGFNLQIAWTTGHLAGTSAAQKTTKEG